MKLDSLIEISRDATLEASKALSRFVAAPVSLGTVRVEMKKELELTLDVEPAEQFYVISGPIVGDASGIATLALPAKTAFGLCDLLFKRQLGTTCAITQEEQDALQELGNIVVGNYLRAFARALPGKTLVHKTAKLIRDASTNLIKNLTSVCEDCTRHNALLFEVTFNFRHAALIGCVMVVIDSKCLQELLESAATI